MPEAVMVTTGRSTIGRAFNGSLKDIRPDDLMVRMVWAALGKHPELDVADPEDPVLGCGQPGDSAQKKNRSSSLWTVAAMRLATRTHMARSCEAPRPCR